MAPLKKILALWLRIPERGVDILSILLAGAGINIITAAPTSGNALAVLCSGSAITASAVFVSLLKQSASSLSETVEMQLQKARRDLADALQAGQVPTDKQPLTRSQERRIAIQDFVAGSSMANSTSLQVLAAIALSALGLIAAAVSAVPAGSSGATASPQELAILTSEVRRIRQDIQELNSSLENWGDAIVELNALTREAQADVLLGLKVNTETALQRSLQIQTSILVSLSPTSLKIDRSVFPVD